MRKAVLAALVVTVIGLSLAFGPVSGALTLAFVEVVVLAAGVGLSAKAATRVGDLYAATIARSSWPGRHEPE